MNELILLCMEMVGTVAFALSGAMTALRRQMDLLGVMILGLITAAQCAKVSGIEVLSR